MSENVIRFCFTPVLPLMYSGIARRKAIAENPANDPASALEAAALSAWKWKPGRILHVAFLEGLPEVQEKVAFYAMQWSKYANITFIFDNDPSAEIRISFQPGGSWSAVGMMALVEEWFSKREPTMNFGWLDPSIPDLEYSSVVLHEFGHALSMIHEHMSPAAGIQWNREAVIKDLSGPPNNWDLETIQSNVFDQYDETQTQFTQFDPESIMLYPLPDTWTLNGIASSQNYILSEMDKRFIQRLYPW